MANKDYFPKVVKLADLALREMHNLFKVWWEQDTGEEWIGSTDQRKTLKYRLPSKLLSAKQKVSILSEKMDNWDTTLTALFLTMNWEVEANELEKLTSAELGNRFKTQWELKTGEQWVGSTFQGGEVHKRLSSQSIIDRKPNASYDANQQAKIISSDLSRWDRDLVKLAISWNWQ